MFSDGTSAEVLITNSLSNVQNGIRSLCDQIDRLAKESLTERNLSTMKSLVSDSATMIPALRNQLVQ